MNAVNQPAHQRDLAHELGAREDVQVGGASLVAVGLAETLQELVARAGEDPGDVEGGIAHVRARPSVDGKEGSALDAQTSFLDVTVDGRRGESPQRHVFEGRLPPAPQRRGDGDFACGLVEKSEGAVTAFDGRVGRQPNRGEDGLGEVVKGGERPSE